MNLQRLIDQCRDDSERWFPEVKDSLAVMALGLNGEAGEVADIIKKVERGSIELEGYVIDDLAEEIIDVLIYLANLMGYLELRHPIEWDHVYDKKREKNEQRFKSGTVDVYKPVPRLTGPLEDYRKQYEASTKERK
jgi:NTP pyrophosphatase (non-canonical NTP hydrolase)